MQIWKKWLHHIQNLKTDSSAKHDKKNNWNHNNNTFEINNESTQHVIETANERVSRLFYRNNARFVDQSNAWNLKCWKLCNLSAHTQHHKNLQQNNLQASCSCAESKKNISKND